ncbi:class I SAM-dependent methyltransferase [Coleofasciculus sp. FACHB-1120]|uniref:class I SAM-dependent DNA methyltransferase n=1 Tax=Coleofasciculus sp. FACHB-1120 TaxID=2692783 RepID=UPI001686153C|nr:class I SAM-dependent methyltransferase [Coleofasciculus sp. FACHB-1120]MBD2741478.1 class I SAM-dependent methyltransferase [Coleofasciculus sp. FACHB-1120]
MSSATFYSNYDPFAQIYNESWGPDHIKTALPYLEHLLLPHLPEEGHILDLCCGTGQLAQYLRKKGYQVTGVDSSEAMLTYARQQASDSKFILSDVRFLKLPSTFHAVVSTSYGLNHVLDIDELISVFKNVYAALLENGLFVFDLSLQQRYQSSWNGSMLGDVKDDYAWAMVRNYDAEEQVGQINMTIFSKAEINWQRLDTTWLVKGYSIAEVQSALNDAGFEKVSVYNTESELAPPDEAGIVYFVCRK